MAESQPRLEDYRCPVCSAIVPANAKRTVCSSGCGLVNLIPRNPDGPLPASWPLVWVVTLFFALFNQLLVASMVWVKATEGLNADAGVFATISFGIGGLWLILAVFILLKIRIFQLKDGLIAALALAVVAVPWGDSILEQLSYGYALQFALGNLLFGAWLGRKLGCLRT